MESVKNMLAEMDEFKSMVAEQKEAIATAEADEAAADQAKNTKLAAAVDCAYIIASADGNASASELSHIIERMGVLTDGEIDSGFVKQLLDEAETKVGSGSTDACIEGICAALPTDAERKAAFTVAACVSWGGGGIGTQEGLALQKISGAFGWEMADMHKILGAARA